jgi:hypothetical protein
MVSSHYLDVPPCDCKHLRERPQDILDVGSMLGQSEADH